MRVCKDIREKFSLYLDGEALSEENLFIEKHLQECEPCRRILSDLKKVKKTLSCLNQSTLSAEPPVSITEDISRQLPASDFKIFNDPVMCKLTVSAVLFMILVIGGIKLKDIFIRDEPYSFARITYLQGKVDRYYRGRWQEVKSPLTLQPQDILKTNDNANVKIQLAEGSSIFIKENSWWEIKDFSSKQEFILNQGEVLVSVAKSDVQKVFIIHTSLAEIHVYGTAFKVSAGGERVEVEVLEGEVCLKNVLNEGKTAIVKPREKLLVTKIPRQFSVRSLEPKEVDFLKKELAGTVLFNKIDGQKKKVSIIFWREVK